VAPATAAKLSAREQAIRDRDQKATAAAAATALARAAVPKAKAEYDAAMRTVAPFKERLIAAHNAVRSAELAEEQAVARANAEIMNMLTDRERDAIESWKQDLDAAFTKACGARSVSEVEGSTPGEIAALSRSLRDLMFVADPVAEIARLRAQWRIPELDRPKRRATDREVVEAARKLVGAA
jgi:hypothetical protein